MYRASNTLKCCQPHNWPTIWGNDPSVKEPAGDPSPPSTTQLSILVPLTLYTMVQSEPTAEEGKRCVIIDLSFPEGDVNASIHPRLYNGQEVAHSLPTITDLLQMVRLGNMDDTLLAVMDISRAYRHFPVCPLDWPLLVLKHGHKYYFDMAIPFGARLPSFVMQMAAQFIIRALDRQGIRALMYLDDLIFITTQREATAHYNQAIDLLGRLGLEVASHK